MIKERIDSDGCLYEEWRNEAGLFHREKGPAQISYYRDGPIEYEEFCIDGEYHRESGPAYIHYNLDGSINHEAFYVSGKFLGNDKKGFWALWGMLSEVERQAPDILKCLARYS